ncbi:MAG: bile acid:sodium symporter family protein [Candidatus Spyradosoma sp.]
MDDGENRSGGSAPAASKKSGGAFYKDWFLYGMIGCVGLATLFPEVGRTGGTLRADELANWGVALVFFFHGLGLSWANLRNGLLAWKVHTAVQAMTFGVFPLLTFLFCLVFEDALGWLPAQLALGFYFLGALPSTISSSVAMTAIARGNVPAAIFNASVSSLLGIVLTPLLIGVFATTSGDSLPLGKTILDLFVLLFLPFLLGQALRPLLRAPAERFKKHINVFDKLVILLIVFSSFADSVARGLWNNYGVSILAQTFAGTLLILFVALCVSFGVSKLCRFDKESEITTVFCGSKKTLASGVPMAKVIFGAAALSGDLDIGLIVLPIMFYHQLQLLVCTILANRYAKRL